MHLIILGSSSKGNGYILRGATGSLILEAGVPLMEVKKALNFDLTCIAACLVTHEHGDHAKYVKDYLSAGIPVFMSYGTAKALNMNHHRLTVFVPNKLTWTAASACSDFGYEFTFRAFKVVHDAADPVCYLIRHEECGTVLFLTDTHYSPYRFNGLNNIIIECNYSREIIDRKTGTGIPKVLRDRIIQNHMELKTVLEFLSVNDTSAVNNIVLIHLSESNSDSKEFIQQVKRISPGKQVTAADKGMIIEFNKTVF